MALNSAGLQVLGEEASGVAKYEDGLYILFNEKMRVLLLAYVEHILICIIGVDYSFLTGASQEANCEA